MTNNILFPSIIVVIASIMAIPAGIAYAPCPGSITGTSGNDKLIGPNDQDIIFGLDGDDKILAGDGNGIIFPGPGADRINADGGDDAIVLQEGDDDVDRINCGDGEDTVYHDYEIEEYDISHRCENFILR